MIDELERFPRIRANTVDTTRMLKHVQKRDLETATRIQIMVNQSHLGAREKLIHATKLKDVIVG